MACEYDGDASFFTGKLDDFTTVGDWLGRVPALELARPKRGEIVVDAGCGAGLVSRMIARVTGPGTVYGCDQSTKMLEAAIAHERIEPLGIEYHQADITFKFPIKDCSADLVVCIAVAMHLSPAEMGSFLCEARHALRPGGRLLISTIHPLLFNPYSNARNCLPPLRWMRLDPIDDEGQGYESSRFTEHYTDCNGKVLETDVWYHPETAFHEWFRDYDLTILRQQSTYTTPEVIAKSLCWAGSPTGHPAFLQFLAQKPQ